MPASPTPEINKWEGQSYFQNSLPELTSTNSHHLATDFGNNVLCKQKAGRMTRSPAPGGRACDFKAANRASASSGIKDPVWIKGKGSCSP